MQVEFEMGSIWNTMESGGVEYDESWSRPFSEVQLRISQYMGSAHERMMLNAYTCTVTYGPLSESENKLSD